MKKDSKKIIKLFQQETARDIRLDLTTLLDNAIRNISSKQLLLQQQIDQEISKNQKKGASKSLIAKNADKIHKLVTEKNSLKNEELELVVKKEMIKPYDSSDDGGSELKQKMLRECRELIREYGEGDLFKKAVQKYFGVKLRQRDVPYSLEKKQEIEMIDLLYGLDSKAIQEIIDLYTYYNQGIGEPDTESDIVYIPIKEKTLDYYDNRIDYESVNSGLLNPTPGHMDIRADYTDLFKYKLDHQEE